MANTNSTPITLPEFYCKQCKKQKDVDDFAIKDEYNYFKTCNKCRADRNKRYNRVTPAKRIRKSKEERTGPEMMGNDKKYLDLLKKPMRRLCDEC